MVLPNLRAPELQVQRFAPGSVVRGDDLDEHLVRRGDQIRVRMRSERYSLPKELEDLAGFVLNRTTSGKWPTNGTSLRLVTDPRHLSNDSHAGSLIVQPVGYFDYLCSNELMKFQLRKQGKMLSLLNEFMLTDNALLGLDESELANVIGVSTVAVTTDGYALLVLQTEINSASGGLLAPSGSGSLEPQDLATSLESTDLHGSETDLLALVAAGATREMREETGIPKDFVGATRLLGYGRWVERGAKPEFYATTQLKGTKAEIGPLLKPPKGRERMYTGGIEWVPLETALRAVHKGTQPDDAASNLLQTMSLPLELCLRRMLVADDESVRLASTSESIPESL